MSDHAWTQDHIAAYLAGGLDSAEAERFEAHIAACAICTTTLAGARHTDAALSSLFAPVRPGPTLEDRLLKSLRGTPKAEPRGQFVWKLGGWKKKLAIGLAASLVLGATGAVVSQLDELPFPGMADAVPIRLVEGGWVDAGGSRIGRESEALARSDVARSDVTRSQDGAPVLTAASPAPDISDRWGKLTTQTPGFQSGRVPAADGKFHYSNGADPNGTVTKLDDLYSLEKAGGENKPKPAADVILTPNDDLGVTVLRGRTGKDVEEIKKFLDGAQATRAEAAFKSSAAAFADVDKSLQNKLLSAQPAPPVQGDFRGGAPGAGGRGFGGGGIQPNTMPTPTEAPVVATAVPTAPQAAVTYFIPDGAKAPTTFGLALPPMKGFVQVPGDGKPKAEPARDATTERGEGGDKGDKNKLDEATKKPAGEPKPEGAPKPEPKAIPGADGQPAPGTGQPAKVEVARKIIIRSGDVEYEIESFDTATAAITKLTLPIPGAYVATVNSEKLPNGKVKGVIVVRTPPEHLDAFMLALRAELTKNGTGELKSQKIGSSDITKMYTDMESRLKAARAMETRLLKMIQDGKGDIKQLLEAERELGVWRTKIEELEGELRYYGSLAALSTLTITLVEREIRAAAVVTESEVVQSGVEVEDVDLAFREATKAIFDAKGRITKSELKQLTGGQYNATLNFEVAPEQSGAMRDRLKQLGRIARLEINRVLNAEGTPVKGMLPKRGDTQFFVQFYNLANIAPRETATASVAVADVPAAYATLRTAIEKAKGRVINAQLNETDKANVSATLDFEVKRPEDGAIQLALQGVGETLSRNVTRAAESDTVTDTKVLFRLTLSNANRLTPRETTTVAVAVPDLPTSYKAVLEAVEKAKGRILTSNLNETDRQNVNAQIDFEAKRSDEVAFLTALGTNNEILSRSTTRAPDATNVTDSKVLFRVTMSSLARLQPSETISLIVAVTDIPAGYKSVLASVERQKGRVVTASLNEGDLQNVTAQLDFEVKRADEPTVTTAIGPNGDVLSRKSVQAPAGTHVTESKVLVRVTFVNALRLKPRETATLAIEVENVETTAAAFASHVADAKGRVVDSQVAAERDGKVTARLVYDVPLAAAPGVIERFKKEGKVRVQSSTRDVNATDGKFAIARLDVTLSNQDLIVPSDSGVGPQMRKGLSNSVTVLLSSLSYLIFGLFVILPWALIGYAAYRVVRYLVRKPTPTPDPVPVPVTTPTT